MNRNKRGREEYSKTIATIKHYIFRISLFFYKAIRIVTMKGSNRNTDCLRLSLEFFFAFRGFSTRRIPVETGKIHGVSIKLHIKFIFKEGNQKHIYTLKSFKVRS